jgi:hypothetical protein
LGKKSSSVSKRTSNLQEESGTRNDRLIEEKRVSRDLFGAVLDFDGT